MRPITRFLLPGVLAGALFAQPASAADHRDGPKATSDKTTDINDVYTWTAGGKLYLAMTVFPDAPKDAAFSNSAEYVFHISARAKYLDPSAIPVLHDLICNFKEKSAQGKQIISCWLHKIGDAKASAFVRGDASLSQGIENGDKTIRVFAGLRNDPFFFNLEGFNEVRKAVKGAIPGLVAGGALDANGCPDLPMDTRAALVNQLRKAPGGDANPVDTFAKFNTLAIVVALDGKILANLGGSIVGVWGGTHVTGN